MTFDEGGHVRALRDNFPMLVARFIQRGTDQGSSHALSTKTIGNIGVVKSHAGAIMSVAHERKLAIHLHLETLLGGIMDNMDLRLTETHMVRIAAVEPT